MQKGPRLLQDRQWLGSTPLIHCNERPRPHQILLDFDISDKSNVVIQGRPLGLLGNTPMQLQYLKMP